MTDLCNELASFFNGKVDIIRNDLDTTSASGWPVLQVLNTVNVILTLMRSSPTLMKLLLIMSVLKLSNQCH